MVLTIQGLCPSDGTASSISGWVLTKLSISSGNEFEELNLEPWTAQPPGLKTANRAHRQYREKFGLLFSDYLGPLYRSLYNIIKQSRLSECLAFRHMPPFFNKTLTEFSQKNLWHWVWWIIARGQDMSLNLQRTSCTLMKWPTFVTFCLMN